MTEVVDFGSIERELSDVVLEDPFGRDRMLSVDPAEAAGMLACMYKGSKVDDDDSGDQVSKSDDYVAFADSGIAYEGDATSLN